MHSRLHRRLATFATSLAVAAAGLVLGPVSPAGAADAAVPPMGPVFNRPTGDVAQQRAIRDRARAMIAAADSGSTIRMALYHFWDKAFAQELAAAHTARNINVQVVLDETTVSTEGVNDVSYDTLRAALGTDLTKPSYVKLCTKGRSCLGPTAGAGINHNKFLLFSSLGGGTAKQVVLQMTSNLTPSNYSRYWNSAVGVAGNADLYASYDSYFVKLGKQDRAHWTYTSANAGAYKAYFFPRAGSDNDTDTVVNALDNIACTWTDSAGTHRTAIRAAMLKITRQGVADKLRSLAAAGCTVDLVYSETDSGTWNALHGQTRLTTRCYQHDDDGDASTPNPTPNRIVHSKNLMIDGMYAGAREKLVFTGSHNWSGPALRDNDESMIRINADATYDAFVTNFNDTRAAAVPGTADNVTACK
ncbi:phospholipase D-like domain-containing protein [Streptomyces sp. NPDC054863]